MQALGGIETFGIVYVLEAADAMEKASGVEIIGYENVGAGYMSVLVRGDVAAVESAVDAGLKAVKKIGGEAYASLVLASPHPELEEITKKYTLD